MGTKIKDYTGWAWYTFLLTLIIMPFRLMMFNPVLTRIIFWLLLFSGLFFLVLGLIRGIEDFVS